ncbi:unnamed protein product [Gongylonema pulchrum]|uniref:Uncharacterized protein n=1 Tax=Gongylonema pulchrum TaxID=637853 RepID=A0A183EQL6_9BILA|nr:unnamed protein product [Gongylonema pulchrum]
MLTKTGVLRLSVACNSTQPVRAKAGRDAAKRLQATSSAAPLAMKNQAQKGAVLDGFVEFMIKKTFMAEVKNRIENSNLCEEFDWTQTEIIHAARVPILHLQTRNHMQVDIQFEKYASIRNTHYVRHCVQCTGSYGIQPVLPVVFKKFKESLRPSLPIQQIALALSGKPVCAF